MPEQSTERQTHIRVVEVLNRRLRTRCDELDTAIHDFVVKLLDREPVDDDAAKRNGPRKEEQDL